MNLRAATPGERSRGSPRPRDSDTHRLPRSTLSSPWRVRTLALVLVLLVSGVLLGAPAVRWLLASRTPLLGVAVHPDWLLVRGTLPVAVVTLAIPDARHASFRDASLREKEQYARARGYHFVVCNATLDAARLPVWSKLRLIAAVMEQVAPTVLWLDLDTILWTRHLGVEALAGESPAADLHAQHDFHRFKVYFNAGVMLLRRSDWMLWLLNTAYDTRRVMVFRKLVYNMEEQDALNLAAALSQRRPKGTPGNAQGWKVRVHTYPRLWAFPNDAFEEDGRVAEGILALHMPNCRDGVCAAAYQRHVEVALRMPTDKGPNAGNASALVGGLLRTRTYGAHMPLRTSWFHV